MHTGEELHGWKEICAYLGVTARTAQNYEAEQRLPVHRGPGPKARVWAVVTEIDAWKQERDRGPVEPATPPVDPPPVRTHRFWGIGVAVALIAAAGLTVLGLRPHWGSRIPVSVSFAGSTLIVRDAEDREAWRHTFPHRIGPFEDTAAFRRLWALGDIDGDGEVEVIVVDTGDATPQDVASREEELLCFSQDGQSIKWRFKPGRPVKDNTGEQHVPPYYINNVAIVPDRPSTAARIIVSSNHYLNAPDQVAVLDGSGKLVGEYWHPGHLLRLAFADLDHDGHDGLLLAGVNNAEHAATLLAFDPDRVSGTSTGASDPRYELKGFGPGSEKAIVFFDRTCTIRSGPNAEPYNRVAEMFVTGSRIVISVAEGIDQVDPRKAIYELDYQLNLKSVMPSVELQHAHEELERAGIVHHSLLDDNFRELRSAMVVRRNLLANHSTPYTSSTLPAIPPHTP